MFRFHEILSHPVLLASLGAVFQWMALPPTDLWPLAWVASIPWLILIDSPRSWSLRQYVQWGIVGFFFWMAALHWLRLPHWATSFGWVALSFYLGWYLPVFIGLSRIGIQRLRLPICLVAATVWAGLEVVRAHLLTGFTMASLSHTQYRWISLIQIADLGGAYAVSWIVMFETSCLYVAGKRAFSCWISRTSNRETATPKTHGWDAGKAIPRISFIWHVARPIVEGGFVLGVCLLYGYWRLSQLRSDQSNKSLSVALIQGSEDIRLEDNEEKRDRIHRHYLELAFRAARDYPDVDIMVWPETVYGGLLIDRDDNAMIPSTWKADDLSQEQFANRITRAKEHSERALVSLAETLGCRLLLGVETISYTKRGPRIFNSAAYVGYCYEKTGNTAQRPDLPGGSSDSPPDGKQEQDSNQRRYCFFGRYDKMHLVMFGEYVPFAETIPILQRMTPLSTSTTPGKIPVAFPVGNMRLSPNICYESVIPHLIRRQVLELRASGQEPDVLVNLTNDGWFWGSSELDMHLICGVFRAVETRKPFLVAANTGFSAHIGPDGRIYQQGPRRDVAILIADVKSSPLRSLYLDFGIIPNSLLVSFIAFLGLAECFFKLKMTHKRPMSHQSA